MNPKIRKGRKPFKSRKQKRIERLNRKDDRDNQNSPTIPYADIVKKNENFEFYYKQQNIVDSESEWNEFISILSEPLPLTFRISSYCNGQTQKMRDIIQSNFVQNILVENENNHIKDLNIYPIPWYPNNLAWTINLSKIEIRKSPSLTRFRNFLISETETGSISRQEAVSMIPPLLLDIKCNQKVLDMCAAPGSKTAQIIEMLQKESGSNFIDGENQIRFLDGLVVANDVDNRRCYMLVHQSKRLSSPCVVIINHDASNLPDFYQNDDKNGKTPLKFDRVLADVPCSADGTIRKNYDIWTKWNIGAAHNLHYLQLKIAKRGIELLAKDGIMAYSTCSLNPIENEAVIATLLNLSNGDLELINVSNILPELKYRPGLQSWTVITRDNEIINSPKEVPQKWQTQIKESLFPPSNVSELNLNYCIRIMPHYQNTGGFFIALIKKKVDNICWNSCTKDSNTITNQNDEESSILKINATSVTSNKQKRKFKGFREDPFYFLDENDKDWLSLKSYYCFPEHFPSNQLAHRCTKGRRRNLYYLTSKAANFLRSNQHINLITGGARVFSRNDLEFILCPYRITQEGISTIFPYFIPNLEKYNFSDEKTNALNIIKFDYSTFVGLLLVDCYPVRDILPKIRNIVEKMPSGFFIAYGDIYNYETKFILPICVWKGNSSIRAYVSKNDRTHMLRICNVNRCSSKTDSKEEELSTNRDYSTEEDNDDDDDDDDDNGNKKLKLEMSKQNMFKL